MFNRHIKEIRCLDCKHCDVKEMKCYPESLDCKPEYDLDYEDIYEYHKNNCDFYNMDYWLTWNYHFNLWIAIVQNIVQNVDNIINVEYNIFKGGWFYDSNKFFKCEE